LDIVFFIGFNDIFRFKINNKIFKIFKILINFKKNYYKVDILFFDNNNNKRYF